MSRLRRATERVAPKAHKRSIWRRDRDSNPSACYGSPDFESGALPDSAISPLILLDTPPPLEGIAITPTFSECGHPAGGELMRNSRGMQKAPRSRLRPRGLDVSPMMRSGYSFPRPSASDDKLYRREERSSVLITSKAYSDQTDMSTTFWSFFRSPPGPLHQAGDHWRARGCLPWTQAG